MGYNILYHIMSQLFRRCMGLFQCYLLLVIEWKQSRFFLSDVTGNAEQEKRTDTHQIWHKVHRIIRVSYVVTKVIMLQNAANHKCRMLSMNMKVAFKISTWATWCEGLTDGVGFVAKRKKSKITWRIMNAFQFSIMCTIMDAFLVIRSKVAIECAQ